MAIWDTLAEIRELLRRHHRAAFLAALACIVAGAAIFGPTWGRAPAPQPGDRVQAQQVQEAQEARGAQGGLPSPLVSGPVLAAPLPLPRPALMAGGETPRPPGVAVLTVGKGSWHASENFLTGQVTPATGVVTWPLGAKYARLRASVDFFLPPAGEDLRWWGGQYELLVDGKKVWARKMVGEDILRASGDRLDVSLSGARALTLRIAPAGVVLKSPGVGPIPDEYRATTPFGMVLYNVELAPAPGGAQGGGDAGGS